MLSNVLYCVSYKEKDGRGSTYVGGKKWIEIKILKLKKRVTIYVKVKRVLRTGHYYGSSG